jgi:hypothetical protein
MVIPVLLAPARAPPVDLMLAFDGKRVRAGDSPPALLPFEQGGQLAAAVELPGGGVLVLDAGKPAIVIAGREAARAVAQLSRVIAHDGTRLTLGVALDGARGPAIVGYSLSSGEVFAGALDVGRTEVGPLKGLGSMASLGERGVAACGAGRPTHRLVAELRVALRVTAKSGRVLLDETVAAAALLVSADGHLCVEGLELGVRERAEDREGVGISAGFGAGRAAAVRTGDARERLSCTLEGA